MPRKRQHEIFVSIDVETDGPAPGLNSMLALGAAAFGENGAEIGGWYSNMQPLPTGQPDPTTMQWWMQPDQADAWREVNDNPNPPDWAMTSFVEWLDTDLRGHRLIAVGWPIAFDFAFVNWYCHKFAGRNPLGFAGLDIRSYANGLANYDNYYGLPEHAVWNMAGPLDNAGLRPHHALDDATGQGRLFMALRLEALRRREIAGDGSVNVGAIQEIKLQAREETIQEIANMRPDDRAKVLSIYRHPSNAQH